MFERLWLGYLPLGTTYWMFGVGAKLVLGLILVGLEDHNPESMVTLSMFAFNLAYSVFISVAIWRSADHYRGRRTWAGLAKVAVVFSWLRMPAQLVA
jgi:hypothetical protein